MKYKIYINGKLIAEFEEKSDRDICIKALSNEYSDCNFTTEEK